MEFKKLTAVRAVLAVVSTALELTGIWLVWQYLLPYYDINLPVTALIAALSVWLIFSIWLFTFTTAILKRQKPVGVHSLVGARGKVVEKLNPLGMVRIKNELWNARSTESPIEIGADIVVIVEDGLTLHVMRQNDVRR